MKIQINKNQLWVLVLLSIISCSTAHAALDAYMTIVGQSQGEIEGDVTSPGKNAGSFKITEFHHLIRKPSRIVHEPLIITTHLGQAMPLLLSAMDIGEPLTVNLKFYRPIISGKLELYYSMDLLQATIIAAEPIMLDNTSAETASKEVNVRLRFNYTKIIHTYEINGQSVKMNATF